MSTQASPTLSFPTTENAEDDPATASDSQYVQDDIDSSQAQNYMGKDGLFASELSQVKEQNRMHKRRRVTRACDECRRKKIKCDGKQPCTHCTVYSYDCTYDQPSNRRRNPAPQHIEALESRLHKAEALLRVVLPDLNLDDPQFDVHATEQMLATLKKERQSSFAAKSFAGPPPAGQPPVGQQPEANTDAGDESLLEPMVDNSGSLDLDDQGHWDYHGHSSGIIFIRRLRKQLGRSDLQNAFPQYRSLPQIHDSPIPQLDSPHDSHLTPTQDLPSQDVARRLCHNALEICCALMRFVHEPSFFSLLDSIYETPPEQYTNQENSFLPLLYIVMAVGSLFSNNKEDTLDLSGYEGAIDQGFHFFKAGRQLIDITECRDLMSLQAICFMVLFLQSSAKLSTCYSYVGIALRSALRLGLHRSVHTKFNPVEQEMRKRIFWLIRKMDVYASTLLGLPQMLSEDDIDQEYPLVVDDECITPNGILPMPPNRTPLMAGSNAHARLTNIILKVVKYIYPIKNVRFRSKSDNSYMVSHSKIREIERELQNWMEELPSALRPGTEVSPQLERIRQLLRISYAHVQMVMYRPFLHYVSGGSQARGVDKRSYACAAACVSVSRNIIHITTGMHRRGLLSGSFWFTMYTTYFAILSLIFFVLENPDSPTAKDGVLKDAMEGKTTLAGLAKKSMAADRCSQSLTCLFRNLPELLKNRQSSNKRASFKRPAPLDSHGAAQTPQTPSELGPPPKRANTFPAPPVARQLPESSSDSNTPRSYDNTHSYNSTPPSSWLTSSPEFSREQYSIAPDAFTTDQINPSSTATSFPSSFPSQSPSSLTFPQPFRADGLPDLMPIMFPSEDPFAYPTQPMSTLEDGHFRNDNAAAMANFNVDAASQRPPFSTSPSNTQRGAMGLSTSGLENFNIPAFPDGTAAGFNPGTPAHFQAQNQQARSRMQSPISHGHNSRSHSRNASRDYPHHAPGNIETGESPDLVSIPNQNFIFQGLSYQPQVFSSEQPGSIPLSTSGGSQNFNNMGMDGNTASSGLGIDMNVPLDDIFGTAGSNKPTGPFPTDDEWFRWMM